MYDPIYAQVQIRVALDMFVSRSLLPQAICLVSATAFVTNQQYSKVSCHSEKDSLSIYITPESRKSLDKYFEKKGIKHNSEGLTKICVGNSLTKADIEVYEPLLGENAVFRLKGLLHTKEGDIVGVGRVGTMVGELKHDKFHASLPVSQQKFDEVTLHDMPTRLMESHAADGKPVWKGRIPPGKVGDRVYYSAVKNATYLTLPVAQQIVISGVLCTDKHVDDKGNCTFDRSTIVPVLDTADSSSLPRAPSPDNTTKGPSADDDGETCPMCRYMKAGPCREEFVTWNTCIKGVQSDEELQSCFEVTAAMMRCMRAHEHYDIMSAGMDFSVVDSVDAKKKSGSVAN